MDLKASWRKYMSLVPDNSSVGSGAQTILAGGRLKRRRPYDPERESTKNAKLKLMEENASESPLLRLPAEIRLLIFKQLLGGHYIHVEQLHHGMVDRFEKKDMQFGQGLWNEICRCPDTESSAYDTFVNAQMVGAEEDTPFDKTKDGEDAGRGYHIDSWTHRHRLCGQEPDYSRFNIALEEWKSRERLSLACLRTCRMIHNEARTLAYSENVFLFKRPMAFQAFAASIRSDHFSAMHHISLPVAAGSAPFSDGRARLWTAIIWSYHLATRIRRLKILDITLELYFPRAAFEGRQQGPKPRLDDCIDEVSVSTSDKVDLSTTWLEQLARLSNEVPTFRVVVCDDPLSMWGVSGYQTAMKDFRMRDIRVWTRERNVKCLTVEQKQVLARQLESRLRKCAGQESDRPSCG